MNATGEETMERQMAVLRNSVRRSRQLAILSLLVPGLVFAAGLQQPARQDAVEAGQFVLTSKDGTVQAKIFVNEKGFPRLHLFAKEGKSRVEIGISDLGAGVEVSEGGEEVCARLFALQNGAASLQLEGRDAKRLSLVALKRDKRAEISLGDTDGDNELSLVAAPDEAFVTLLTRKPGDDPDAREVALSLGADAKGGSGITLADPRQKRRLVMDGGTDGRTCIRIVDAQNKDLFRAPSPE